MCGVPLPYRIIHLPLYCQHLSSLNDLFCSTYFIIKIKMSQRLWFVYEFEFKSEQFTINFKVNKTVKMISVTWSEMNWSKLMNHSSILVNQADFMAGLFSTAMKRLYKVMTLNLFQFTYSIIQQTNFEIRSLNTKKIKVMNMDGKTLENSARSRISTFRIIQSQLKPN